MLPVTLQSIRSHLAPLATNKRLIRALPERSDKFLSDLDGKDVITLYWSRSEPADVMGTDRGLMEITSTLNIDVRLLGMMDTESGLLQVVQRIMGRLLGFTPAAAVSLDLQDATFEGYSEVSKAWVARLRFYVHWILVPDRDLPYPDSLDATVREIQTETEPGNEPFTRVRSLFSPVPIQLHPTQSLEMGRVHLVEVSTAQGQTLLSLPVTERDTQQLPFDLVWREASLRSAAVYPLGMGEFARVQLISAHHEVLMELTASSPDGNGQVQGFAVAEADGNFLYQAFIQFRR